MPMLPTSVLHAQDLKLRILGRAEEDSPANIQTALLTYLSAKKVHIPDFKYRDLDGFQMQIQESNLQSEEQSNTNLFNKKN